MANGESESFIENLLAEHRRVDAMLREAWSAIVQSRGPDVDAASEDVAVVLRRVREDLARHFAEEEAGGCLEEAVTKCPRFSCDEIRILAEHPELLDCLDSLIEQIATAFEETGSRHAFEIDFGDFCRRVHAHEAAENELIRQALGAAIDVENCAQGPQPTDF
jgi:hypothetical protein